MAHSASPSAPNTGTELTPGSFRGQPLVIAAAPCWPSASPRALGRLHAELRSLGAVLVLLTPHEIACLQPDELFDPGGARRCDRAAFEALLAGSPAPGRGTLRCAIVSPTGSRVWTRQLEAPSDPIATLVSALSSAATQAVHAGYGITLRELVTTLIAAFSLSFEAACRSTPKPAEPSASIPASRWR